MKRCTYCKQRAVSASGLCFKCGHSNTKFDYWMAKWAPVVVGTLMLCFVLLAGFMLVVLT